MMNIDVLGFGIVKDIFQQRTITIHLSEGTIAKLKETLEETYPDLRKLSFYMIAVNNEYASGEMQLKEGDEIAIIPPVSGG